MHNFIFFLIIRCILAKHRNIYILVFYFRESFGLGLILNWCYMVCWLTQLVNQQTNPDWFVDWWILFKFILPNTDLLSFLEKQGWKQKLCIKIQIKKGIILLSKLQKQLHLAKTESNNLLRFLFSSVLVLVFWWFSAPNVRLELTNTSGVEWKHL